MARIRKVIPSKHLVILMQEICDKNTPDKIQAALAGVYGRYSGKSRGKSEAWFWYKCHRASTNLASGMRKWIVEDL